MSAAPSPVADLPPTAPPMGTGDFGKDAKEMMMGLGGLLMMWELLRVMNGPLSQLVDRMAGILDKLLGSPVAWILGGLVALMFLIPGLRYEMWRMARFGWESGYSAANWTKSWTYDTAKESIFRRAKVEWRRRDARISWKRAQNGFEKDLKDMEASKGEHALPDGYSDADAAKARQINRARAKVVRNLRAAFEHEAMLPEETLSGDKVGGRSNPWMTMSYQPTEVPRAFHGQVGSAQHRLYTYADTHLRTLETEYRLEKNPNLAAKDYFERKKELQAYKDTALEFSRQFRDEANGGMGGKLTGKYATLMGSFDGKTLGQTHQRVIVERMSNTGKAVDKYIDFLKDPANYRNATEGKHISTYFVERHPGAAKLLGEAQRSAPWEMMNHSAEGNKMLYNTPWSKRGNGPPFDVLRTHLSEVRVPDGAGGTRTPTARDLDGLDPWKVDTSAPIADAVLADPSWIQGELTGVSKLMAWRMVPSKLLTNGKFSWSTPDNPEATKATVSEINASAARRPGAALESLTTEEEGALSDRMPNEPIIVER